MTRAAVLSVALLVAGCSDSLEQARIERPLGAEVRDSERCRRLDRVRRDWSAVAAASGVLAGSQGIATLPVDDDGARAGLAAGALATGALAAAAVAISDRAGEAWARECSR